MFTTTITFITNYIYYQSLVDHNDNVGVGVDDITVIIISPHWNFNIFGINNHDINSVPIVTIGALAHS